MFLGADDQLQAWNRGNHSIWLLGGKLNYETKLSSAGLIFWFYGKLVIAKILNLDQNKEHWLVSVSHQCLYLTSKRIG